MDGLKSNLVAFNQSDDDSTMKQYHDVLLKNEMMTQVLSSRVGKKMDSPAFEAIHPSFHSSQW